MAEIRQFRTRDQVSKEQIKKDMAQFVDEGDFIVLLVHRDTENLTDLITNLNFESDRIGLKGILAEGQEILTLVSPVVAYRE